MQRGLELVRDVRRELAPYALRPAPLRHVEDEQNRASARDRADCQLVLEAHALYAGLGPLAAASPLQQRAQLRAAVHGQDVLSDAVLTCAEDPARSGIDAQHPALRVQKDEPLRHAARDGFEFAPPPVKLVQLGAYLPLLPLHAGQQGRELVVCLVFKRMVQVYGV